MRADLWDGMLARALAMAPQNALSDKGQPLEAVEKMYDKGTDVWSVLGFLVLARRMWPHALQAGLLHVHWLLQVHKQANTRKGSS